MEPGLLEDLARAFGLTDVDPASLSPWATVHRARVSPSGSGADLDVVVKRTADGEERARAMADWTRHLAAEGIPVVHPLALGVPNPQQVGEDWYVVYPFIAGRPYDAERDLTALGELLGRLHACPVTDDLAAALRPYDWTDASLSDGQEDVDALLEKFHTVLPSTNRSAGEAVQALLTRWWERSLPALRRAEEEDPLPRAGVTSDFKAANVVITVDGPVIVDPDNGGLEPRLLDLALAVVLLHNESDSAPARMLTTEEWHRFHAGYARHVELTDRERALWPAALDHMAWEEGTWVLEDDDADAYASPRQGGFLADLATMPLERYALPEGRGAAGG